MKTGSISSADRMALMQVTKAALKDQKSKSIQNEITAVQQQMQKLSSAEDLSVNEKANERKKLQKEISGLNTELKQHEEELLRSQKREQMLAALREDKNPAKENPAENEMRSEETAPTSSNTEDPKAQNLPSNNAQQVTQPGSVITRNGDGTVILKETLMQDRTPDAEAADKQADESEEESTDKATASETLDNGMSADFRPTNKEIHAMVSADSALQQAGRLGTIISKTSDGIAILKEEIEQARDRDADTERQQAALQKMERQERLAMAFQSSILGTANDAMKSVTDPVSAKEKRTTNTETNAYKNVLNLSQEDWTSQQKFHVSFG